MLTLWRRPGVAPPFAALLAAMVLSSVGCGSGEAGADADAGITPQPTDLGSRSDAAAIFPPPDAPGVSVPCGPGRGRMRVTVSLDPEIALQEPDVWLSVRCGPDEVPVRLVRWDREAVQVLDGFGPGLYRVHASSLVAPGQWSGQLGMEGAATVAVPLTVAAEAAVLGGAASDDLASADAGPYDAGLSPGAWRGSGGLLDPGSRQGVGTVEVEARPLADAADGGVDAGGPRIAVQATLRSSCATPPCPSLSLHSVEARLSDDNVPTAVVSLRFDDGTTLEPNGRRALPRALLLPGGLPGGARVLRLTVYGDVSGVERRR